MIQVAPFIKLKSDYHDACAHTFRGSDGKSTWCVGVGRGSTGRRDGPRAWSGLLGLSGARRRAHRGGRGPAPLAVEVWGGVGWEGGLSLVTGASLLPLATTAAAGGAAGADSWAQTSLGPCGKVINRARQILEQKDYSEYLWSSTKHTRGDMQQVANLNISSSKNTILLYKYIMIKQYYCNNFSMVEIWLFRWNTWLHNV